MTRLPRPFRIFAYTVLTAALIACGQIMVALLGQQRYGAIAVVGFIIVCLLLLGFIAATQRVHPPEP